MAKAELYNRYPVTSVLIYNGTTILHFALGGLLLQQLDLLRAHLGAVVALLYVVLSLIDMYIVMPLAVCRNCVYPRIENGRCISGLSVIVARLLKKRNASDFQKRAIGLFCPNNFYIASLVFPVLCGIPLLVLKFSGMLLLLETALILLLITRFFSIIPVMACLHCRSKFVCPQAGQMGVREK
jgi:hypothetical protein